MNISLAWLNSLLAPGDVSADEAERVLTFVGFPIESKTAQPSGDTLLDVEVTSNRGDCLSHEGVAREVAAATGRKLNLPAQLIARKRGLKAAAMQLVRPAGVLAASSTA